MCFDKNRQTIHKSDNVLSRECLDKFKVETGTLTDLKFVQDVITESLKLVSRSWQGTAFTDDQKSCVSKVKDKSLLH